MRFTGYKQLVPIQDGKLVHTLSYHDLTPGKVYEVMNIDRHGWYSVVDDSGDAYIYPDTVFETVE